MSTKSKKSILSNIIFSINIGFAILLLVASLASLIDPSKYWVAGFLGILYVFLVFINFCFAVLWIVYKRRYFFLSFLLLIGNYPLFNKYFQFNFSSEQADTQSNSVKLFSFNAGLCKDCPAKQDLSSQKALLDLLTKESPDIICLQEFLIADSLLSINLEGKLQDQNYEIALRTTVPGKKYFGVATFSKYPIIRKEVIDFEENGYNMCIVTDICVEKDTIRVYNIHFQSNELKDAYQQAWKSSVIEESKKKVDLSFSVLQKLRGGYTKRIDQVHKIVDHMRHSAYPIIACGDFNDPPNSYTYHTMRSALQDAFLESGKGSGTTYNELIPFLRIDYVLYSHPLHSSGFEIIKRKISDHYPIICVLNVSPKLGK